MESLSILEGDVLYFIYCRLGIIFGGVVMVYISVDNNNFVEISKCFEM